MEPIGTGLLKIGISTATKLVLEKGIKSISQAKWPFGKRLLEELLQDDHYSDFLVKHVSRTIKIRTIHSSDKDVYLNEIYHPINIYEITNEGVKPKFKKVDDGFYLVNNNINNIIGYAGQGKSTVLRKIFIEYIKAGDKIPFFIELHKAENSGILKQLELILLECGLSVNEDKIIELVSCGKIALLLDGFDEITPSKRKNILSEMISLNNKYNVQIITTTRPETDICYESNIVNYKVNLLDKNDILSIMKKLNERSEYIDEGFLERISAILKTNRELVSVMNLPILVTLFYVCYPYLDKVPTNAVDFYSSLFTTLYSMHDKVKNFERFKASDISSDKAYSCFCTLSFTSLYNNDLNFNAISLNNYVKDSMLMNSLDVNEHPPEQLVSDFINITCLIQKDGYDKYVYLHKSVQEYHASEFIRNSSIDKKEKFYNFLFDDFNVEKRFLNVVNFLISTDRENVIKLILLPLCELNGVDKWNNPDDVVVSEIYDLFITNAFIILREIKSTDIKSKFRIVSYTSSGDKYRWINQFLMGKDKSSNLAFKNTGVFHELICNLVFDNSEITKNLTKEFLIKNEITFVEKNNEDTNKKSNRTQLGKLIEATGMREYTKTQIRDKMISLYDVIYKENKEKMNKSDSNLKKAFPFL